MLIKVVLSFDGTGNNILLLVRFFDKISFISLIVFYNLYFDLQ